MGAKPGEVEPEIVFNLGLVYTPALFLMYVVSLGFVAAYRISRATHEANVERLA